ncbi:arginine--tRNA ligase [Candidatus Pacearchaeota archaeon]|nr:arginine--tRNA ligase [Candidatus Pacearchaeota archaeon]
MFKENVIELLRNETKLKPEVLLKLVEVPPKLELGDFAFPCFILSKKLKKAPNQIASILVEKLSKDLPKQIDRVVATGSYVNFFVNKLLMAKKIIKINSNYGKTNVGKKKKVIIDFSAPNVGKPMHVGHIRSTILGDSIIRMYDFLNYNPVGINYLGDIGLHIGKLIVAYELWLDKDQLKKDPVNELLRLYVKFCDKEKSTVQVGTDEEDEFSNNEWTLKAKEKLKQLELGDKKAHKIWSDIQKYSRKGFDKVYDLLKVNFHETVGQSLFSNKGKQIITQAILSGHAKAEPSGAVFVESHGKNKYILRTGKIASYMTQDLGAAVTRFEKHKFEEMIYLTDYRQIDHFNHLFNILELFGYTFAKNCKHLGFGNVKFGKEILATRKGKVILLESVLKKTIEKAREGIDKRGTKGDPKKVGVGAIKYIVLKNEPQRDVQFSWSEALNFEGNTGPYLQYSYARASSIIRKAKKENFNKVAPKVKDLTTEEIALVKKIDNFPEIVLRAAKSLNPAIIANYAYELAKLFNEFYHNNHVIGDPREAFRLYLLEAFRTTLQNSLHLLGIEVMEEM